MHHGILAASVPLEALLAELRRHTGDFVAGEALDWPRDIYELDDDDGFPLAAGEYEGRSFVLDSSFILGAAADMIVACSAQLGTVAGIMAAPVSGAWSLTIARDGNVIRHVHIEQSMLARGLSIGDELPSEAVNPIGDPDGEGLYAALRLFDLDPHPWLQSGRSSVLRYQVERMPATGPIANIHATHAEKYRRAEGDWTAGLIISRRPRDLLS